MTDHNNSNHHNLRYQLLPHLDFEKVKFADAKTNVKKILENICPVKLLLHLVNSLIPFIQIFYLQSNTFLSSVDKGNQISIIIITYGIALFYFKTFGSICTDYIMDEYLTIKFYDLQIRKKYYEMGDLFRKGAILSIFLNMLIYFPIINSLDFFLDFFLFDQITRERIYDYLNINFFTIICLSFNKGIYNLLYSLQRYRMINISICLKFIINVTFCIFLSIKSFNFFFLSGIAWIDLISEISMMLCLVISQYVNNPFPQIWIKIKLVIFKEMKDFLIENIFNVFNFSQNIKLFISFSFFTYWREFLVLINIIFWFSYQDHKLIIMKEKLVIAILIMNLFFSNIKFTKKVGLNNMKIFFDDLYYKYVFSDLSPVNSENCEIPNLTLDFIEYKNRQQFLSGNKFSNSNFNSNTYYANQNENNEKLSIIKTQIFSCILINFFSFLIFYIISFIKLDFFVAKINQDQVNSGSDVFQTQSQGAHISKLFVILILFLNGVINCLCNELNLINDLLENSDCFKQIIICFLFSFMGFIYICNNFPYNLIIILLSFYSGSYFMFYRLYNYVELADMRIITIQKIKNAEKR